MGGRHGAIAIAMQMNGLEDVDGMDGRKSMDDVDGPAPSGATAGLLPVPGSLLQSARGVSEVNVACVCVRACVCRSGWSGRLAGWVVPKWISGSWKLRQ